MAINGVGTLGNVVFLYPRLDKAVLKHKAKEVEGQPLKNKEYVTKVCIPAADFKTLSKKYKNCGAKALKDAKEYSAAKYRESFGVDAPEGFENEDDEYVVVKFWRPAQYDKSGDPCTKPSVVGCKNGRTMDRDGHTIEQSTNVGNGSVGRLQYEELVTTFDGDEQTRLQLKGVQILHLVPYIAPVKVVEDGFEDDEDDESYTASKANEFADDDDDEDDKPTPKPTKKVVEEDEEWED